MGGDAAQVRGLGVVPGFGEEQGGRERVSMQGGSVNGSLDMPAWPKAPTMDMSTTRALAARPVLLQRLPPSMQWLTLG